MSSESITRSILGKTTEDETLSQFIWDNSRDECWGWCGHNGAGHECNCIFTHIVGGAPDAYARLGGILGEKDLA